MAINCFHTVPNVSDSVACGFEDGGGAASPAKPDVPQDSHAAMPMTRTLCAVLQNQIDVFILPAPLWPLATDKGYGDGMEEVKADGVRGREFN